MSGSGGRGIVRARYRFAEWTLRANATVGVRFRGQCLTCGEHSPDTAEADDAQVWCLKHAGLSGHTGYELSAAERFTATITQL